MSESAQRILLVEDDVDVAFSLAQSLRAQNYLVTVAGCAPRAADIAAALVPDVILLDLRLRPPYGPPDGFSVAARLRENPATANIPIIAMTAMQPDGAAAVEGVVQAILWKPFDLQKLLTVVDDAANARLASSRISGPPA